MISVIVPVYNAATTLERCLASLQNQTHRDLEVLMIDDGSTDESGEICRRFSQQDSRFRYLHQENAGVSAARNAGLDAARGEYIGFCDADDWVDEDMYAFLLTLLQSHAADISVCGFYKDTEPPRHSDQIHTYSPKEAIMHMHSGKPFGGHLWDKLFTRSVIGSLRLPTDITILEDMAFVWDVLHRCRKVIHQDVTKYHYIRSSASAMNQFRQTAWSVQTACNRMIANMERYYPDQLVWAHRTALYGNITLARQLGEAGLLSKENYRKVRNAIDCSFSQDALSRLTPASARVVKIFRMGRSIYNGYIGLALLKHRIRR